MKSSRKNLESVPGYMSQDPGAIQVQDELFEKCVDNCLKSAEDVVAKTKTLYDPDDQSLVGHLPSERMEGIRQWSRTVAHDPKGNIDARSSKTASTSDSSVRVTSHGDLSEAGSADDPHPELESNFPAPMMSDIIEEYKKEVGKAIRDERYNKALEFQLKAIDRLEEREKNYNITFEDRVEMKEILAEVYVKLRKPKDAQNILLDLLRQEEPYSETFNRLYHKLATLLLEQKDLNTAERYAKRAFMGRHQNKSPLLNQSISLLVKVYEQQGDKAMANALRGRLVGSPAVHESFASVYDVDIVQEPDKEILWLRRNGFDLGIPDASKHEAMRFAVTKRQSEAVQAILDSMRDHDTKTILAIEAFHWAVADNNVAITTLLLNTNVSIPINALKPHQTALIDAISSGHNEMVQHLLQMRADREARCIEEITPLMHAVRRRDKRIVNVLLSFPADVNATSSGWTALHAAADMGDCEMVSLLLQNDAHIEARSPRTFQKRPFNVANGSPTLSKVSTVQVGDVDAGWTALLRAADRGDEAMVKLLLERGAEVNAKNSIQLTPLMCASEAKHESVVKLLLEWHADVRATNKHGWTALHRAQITKGGVKVAELLLDHGADIEATCEKSQTCLHHAAERGNDSMVSFLINRKANIEAQDIAERTPLHTGIEHRQMAVVRLLVKQGANINAKDKSGRDALAQAISISTSRKSPEIINFLKSEKKRRGSISGSISSSNNPHLSRHATWESSSTSSLPSSSRKLPFLSSKSRKDY